MGGATGSLMAWSSGRTDANHKAVVQALRSVQGVQVSVTSLANVAKGVPDLLVGVFGKTFLCEVKDGDKPLSRRSLTPDQHRFIDQWNGSKVVILLSAAHAVSWIGTLARQEEEI